MFFQSIFITVNVSFVEVILYVKGSWGGTALA